MAGNRVLRRPECSSPVPVFYEAGSTYVVERPARLASTSTDTVLLKSCFSLVGLRLDILLTSGLRNPGPEELREIVFELRQQGSTQQVRKAV